MSVAIAERKATRAKRMVAQDIYVEFAENRSPALIEREVVALIYKKAEYAELGELSYERRGEIIDAAAKEVDEKGGDLEYIKQIVMYAMFKYNLKPGELTDLAARLRFEPFWLEHYGMYCRCQANRRKLDPELHREKKSA